MLQRIFKIRYLLIAVIALTGGYIFISLDEVINHCDIFTSEDNLTWGGPGTSAHKFCSFPDGTDSNMLFATDYPGGGILFRLWNPYTRSARETHLSGFCMNDVAEKYFGQLWADTLNQCAYFVSTKNGADYYLLKITGNQHQGLFVRSYYLYTHPAYQRLRDSLYIAHGKTFYGYRLINRTSDSIRVVAVRDGYRLEISQNIYDTLRPYFVTEGRPFHAYHRKMAKILSETTGAAFTPLDAMRLFYFYNAYYWWKEFFFNKYPFSTDLGFLSANIFGLIDANGDTHPDILINIYSVRYINQLILCYDIHNEKLLWTREFAPHIHSANITDIDHDGQHEIVFTSYSPCSSPDMDYYDKWPETGLPHYSYFRILNADGSNKIINGKKTEYQYPEINFHTIVYLILPEQCKAILGIHTDYGYSTKYLEIYDFKQNRVYQTSVPYQSIRYLNYEDTTVVFINSEIQPGNMGFLLSRTELNPDLSVKRITAKRSSNAKSLYDFLPSPCRPANPYPMLGEKYYITNFNIFSADLRLLYTSDYRFNKSIWKGDEVFFTAMKQNFPVFVWQKFYRVHKPKIWLLWILGAELLVAFGYILIRKILIQPIEKANASYALSYGILGKLFFFQLKGAVALYISQQKRFFLNEKEINDLLNKMDKSYTLQKKLNFIILVVKSYSLTPKDEQVIFSMLAHQLKNQMHYLPLQNLEDQIRQRGHEPIYGNMLALLRTEYDKIQNLSKKIVILMREPGTQKTILLPESIERIMEGYCLHPMYARMDLQAQSKTVVSVQMHYDCLELILRTLIDNALYELTFVPDSRFTITVLSDNKTATVILHNPFNPDRPKKPQSTGYGLMLSKYLIEKYNGDFQYKTSNNEFTVTIRLPLANFHQHT